MFPKSLRLSRMGFDQSRKLSRTASPHFSITYGTLPDAAGFGVIVPKKVAKSAVTRHQLKRRVREALRVIGKELPLPATIVISSRTGAAELSFLQVRDELSAAFNDILAEKPPRT